METPADTDTLRVAATDWSLDGDRKLLDLLQSIHQKITSKCQETDHKLNAMVAALDTASVSLQNVNNRFMALSNAQFVESRVYDDDADTAAQPAPAQKPPENPKKLTESLLKSLATLEAMHEPVTILDDSDSDSDDDMSERESIILKPKDLYAERPLPYIIGSQNWKSKWHAGLILEESDTESTTSRQTDKQTEQFSESESDDMDVQMDRQPEPLYNMAHSTPQQRVDSEESIYRPPMTKIYKPYLPAATLFPDEPPPLDNQESDWDPVQSSESEDDIFAELHRNAPFTSKHKGDIEKNEAKPLKAETPSPEKTNLFQEEDDSLFAEKPMIAPTAEIQAVSEGKTNTKKPVGAISLFGSKKGAESIGAAILKRNQRKSSSDDSEDVVQSNNSHEIRPAQRVLPESSKGSRQSETVVSIEEKEEKVKPKEANIFDELFAKTTKKNTVEVKKVDIFRDIFDDMDDIFTTDVKTETKKAKSSIFDDDLFKDLEANKHADVSDNNYVDEPPPLTDTKAKSKEISNNDNLSKTKSKSIFDDDEDGDLFPPRKADKQQIPEENKISRNLQKKSIFDSDSDDGDIFSKIKPKSDQKDEIINTSKNNGNEIKISSTKLDSGSATSSKTAYIVPNITKLDNDTLITVKPSKNIKDDKPIRDSLETDLKGKSDDDWETDEPVNENENQIDIKETEKLTSIVRKPDISKKPNTIIEKQKPKNDTSDNVPDLLLNNEGQQMSNSRETKENQDKGSLSGEIFADEPPLFEENSRTKDKTSEKPSSKQEHKIPSKLSDDDDDIFSNKKKPANNTEQNSDTNNILPVNDIFDDLFMASPPLDKDKADAADIFSDIPPPITVKEKKTENTNINALFGDDSDDESLFFKTEPPIDDVPPNLDNLETIFHEEPPEFDVDFLSELKPENPKPTQVTFSQSGEKVSDITKDETDQSEAIKEVVTDRNNEIIYKTEKVNQSDNTDAIKPIGKLKSLNLNIDVNSLLPGASPKKTVAKPDSPNKTVKDNSKTIIESPNIETKLVKSVSFDSDPDSLVLDNKLSKGRAKIQVKRRPSSRRARQEAVRKSGIDFVDAKEGPTNELSNDLDLSKEILEEGSNDFCKSDHVTGNTGINRERGNLEETMEKTDFIQNYDNSQAIPNYSSIKNKSNTDVNTHVLNINSEDVYIFKEPKIADSMDPPIADPLKNIDSPKVERKDSKKTVSIFDEDDDDDIFGGSTKKYKDTMDNVVKSKNKDLTEDYRKPAKSGRRLVITDDNDLFGAHSSVPKESFPKPKPELTTSSKITSENEDIFKTMSVTTRENFRSFLDDNEDDLFDFTKSASNTECLNKSGQIQTLGKVYSESEDLLKKKTTKTVESSTGNTKQGTKDQKSNSKSLFDDSSDEELFGGKKSKSKMAVGKKDDDDLFSKKSSVKGASSKATLFDDADDDDLFATRKTVKEPTSQPKAKPSQSQEKSPKSQEIVFDDPLSMFDD